MSGINKLYSDSQQEYIEEGKRKEEGRPFPSSYILLLTMIALVHCGHDNNICTAESIFNTTTV